MIKARVCAGASWKDALILNMSSKGLLVRSDQPVQRGSYLEIRRGHHVMVARVVWSNSGRFGVQTQDPVPAAELIRDPDGARPQPKPVGSLPQERRSAARPIVVRHEASRHKARATEFGVIALACGLAAIFIGSVVAEVVAAPLSAAQAALAGK